MSRKTDRSQQGPGWGEVILGAALSLALGTALGAALLVLRPVTVAKEEPKERARGAVYYIEGSRDAAKGRMSLAKRKAFLEGQSVTITEDEINAMLTPPPAAAPKPDAKAKGAEKAAEPAKSGNGYLSAGTPTVRLHDGKLQVGVPVTLELLGQKIIVQAKGGFVRGREGFEYDPETIYLGSCPIERLPVIAGLVRSKFLSLDVMPDDFRANWTKLKSVSIEGNALKLQMP
ncbi:MAG: hypothetical protein B9S34_10715 [Opitutia bacterium Tous-C1TDCM]|nr:MAG: hypothetical protein B9S34_10715 [Opitutae bacterium Tous-C1TDCM]